MPLIGYLEQMFLFLREKLGEMMTLFHTLAFCGHLWQCFKKMANLVHKSNVCSFWLETLCQGQKNSEANFCFPRHNVFQPKGYIFLGFHPLTFHKPLHFNGFCFILYLQILHNFLDDRLLPMGGWGSMWVCGAVSYTHLTLPTILLV